MTVDDDAGLVRRAIHARGDAGRTGAIVHGALGVVCAVLMLAGGDPVAFSLGAAGLGTVSIWLAFAAKRRRDPRSAPLRALLHDPGKVQRLMIVDEEMGLQIRVTAGGVTDYVCAPGAFDELLATLRRRSPQAVVTDLRSARQRSDRR